MLRIVATIVIALFTLVSCAAPAAPADETSRVPGTPASRGKIFVSAPDKPMILVEPDNAGYQRAYDLLGGDGSHRVNADRWQEVMEVLGWGTPTAEDNARIQEERARWQEQRLHWDNINAFKDHMTAVSADRVVDDDELKRICSLQSQWESQMTLARDYVREYRRDEPGLIDKNPGLQNLEDEAEHALRIVMEAKHTCP